MLAVAAEAAEAEALRRAKAKAERDLVAAVEAGRQEVETVRQQAQADMLNTQTEQASTSLHSQEANHWGPLNLAPPAEAKCLDL